MLLWLLKKWRDRFKKVVFKLFCSQRLNVDNGDIYDLVNNNTGIIKERLAEKLNRDNLSKFCFKTIKIFHEIQYLTSDGEQIFEITHYLNSE